MNIKPYLILPEPHKPEFSREMTECLKGICLILMFIHHFFQFPQYYIEGISYPSLEGFKKYQGHFQICVAGFAFLTGYFYAFSKRQTIGYSIQKIFGLYIGYWVVLIFAACVALITNTFDLSFGEFVLEILAIKHRFLCFCWYVLFYLLAMLYLPLIVYLAKDNLLLWLLFGFFAPIGAYMVLGKYFQSLEKFQVYFPIILGGVLSGRYSLFSRLDSQMKKLVRGQFWLIAFGGLVVVLIVFFEPGWLYYGPHNLIFNMMRKIIRIASIPLFIFGLLKLLELVKWNNALLPLQTIGKYSMLMWFIHGIFFNVSKTITQPILFWPKHPILVTIWGLVLCSLLAWLLNWPVKWTTRKINSLF